MDFEAAMDQMLQENIPEENKQEPSPSKPAAAGRVPKVARAAKKTSPKAAAPSDTAVPVTPAAPSSPPTSTPSKAHPKTPTTPATPQMELRSAHRSSDTVTSVPKTPSPYQTRSSPRKLKASELKGLKKDVKKELKKIPRKGRGKWIIKA